VITRCISWSVRAREVAARDQASVHAGIGGRRAAGPLAYHGPTTVGRVRSAQAVGQAVKPCAAGSQYHRGKLPHNGWRAWTCCISGTAMGLPG
jgi:hypothetical protein